MTKRSQGTWDLGLDYEEWYRTFVDDLHKYRNKRGIRAQRRFTYISILLLQLRNGCRVSEAYDAFKGFVDSGEREIRLTAGKGGTERLLVVPKEIYSKDRYIYRYIIKESDEKQFIDRIKQFARRYYKINTHSLRYALVGFLASRGVSAQLVAKITGHKRLDRILDYTQKVRAEKILKDLDALF
jgi:site-specific recombinase XerD